MTDSSDDSLRQAQDALRNSQEQLRNTQSKWRLIHQMAARLRIERDENHFGPRIQAAAEAIRDEREKP